jgi:uncharacterized membrane protein YhhN
MSLSTGFVATAMAVGALETSWGSWVLAGLAASWLGDLALVRRGRAAFVAGLGAFTLAHGCYLIAFIARGLDSTAAVAGAAVMAAAGAGVLGWLRPNATSLMPTLAVYVTAVAAMVAGAIGTHSYRAAWALLLGAVGFATSDIAVARERFVSPSPRNRMWGLPLYFAAQFLIAVGSGG